MQCDAFFAPGVPVVFANTKETKVRMKIIKVIMITVKEREDEKVNFNVGTHGLASRNINT